MISRWRALNDDDTIICVVPINDIMFTLCTTHVVYSAINRVSPMAEEATQTQSRNRGINIIVSPRLIIIIANQNRVDPYS